MRERKSSATGIGQCGFGSALAMGGAGGIGGACGSGRCGESEGESASWRAGVTMQLRDLSSDVSQLTDKLDSIEASLSILASRSTPKEDDDDDDRGPPPGPSTPASRLSSRNMGGGSLDPMSFMRQAVGIQPARSGSSDMEA